MNLTSRLEQLPVEDWAAAAARITRRTRRRVMRKPARSMGALVAVVAIAAIGSNALWEQKESHPAPIWGGGADGAETGGQLVAAHSPAREVTVEPQTGAPDALVARVQAGLIETGYFNGEADGHLTQGTREAIQVFEVENGLAVTGEPSVALLSAFGELKAAVEAEPEVAAAASAAQPAGPRKITTVAEIQAALNRVGYGPLTVDGVMGPRTRTALDGFAASQQIASNGVTPAVLKALAEAAH